MRIWMARNTYPKHSYSPWTKLVKNNSLLADGPLLAKLGELCNLATNNKYYMWKLLNSVPLVQDFVGSRWEPLSELGAGVVFPTALAQSQSLAPTSLENTGRCTYEIKLDSVLSSPWSRELPQAVTNILTSVADGRGRCRTPSKACERIGVLSFFEITRSTSSMAPFWAWYTSKKSSWRRRRF